MQRSEQRYVDVGRYVAARLPTDAAVITIHHGGSVRYYSHRLTVAWDAVDPAWFDRALAFLRESGHPTYLIFETWEEPNFRKRLASASDIGRLDWPPIAQIDRDVRVYDPADRTRYMAGAAIHTERVP